MSGLDVDALLRRALERAADAAGVVMTVSRSESGRWASATFAGAHHELAARVADGPAAAAWLATLSEVELTLRGHLVADIQIVRMVRADGEIALLLEALTVEDH